MEKYPRNLKKAVALCIAVMFGAHALFSQDAEMLAYISSESTISEGGSNVYSYNDVTYVVSVAQVVVGTKSEANCRTVGAAKAKREMLSFVNGSEITSYTELKTSETTIDSAEEMEVESIQTFTEFIREDVLGNINGVCPLGGWFSEDRSVYYYAIYKIIE